MPRTLRPYQQDAVNAVIDYWSTPDRSRYTPVVVAATGLGKSTIIAALAVKAARLGSRVVMLAHRGELLRQMIDTVDDVAPGEFTTGIVQAENDDHHAQIVAASFQTLASSPARLEQLKDCDVVLVDECFPAGTLIEGQPIESYKVGDTITAVDSTGKVVKSIVTRTMVSVPTAGLVVLTLSTGEKIVTTPNHPFMTNKGWLPAKQLHGVWLHHAFIPRKSKTDRQPSTLRDMWETSGHDPQALPRQVAAKESSNVFQRMRKSKKVPHFVENYGANKSQIRLGKNEAKQPHEKRGSEKETICHLASYGVETTRSWWQRTRPYKTAINVIQSIRRLAYGSHHRDNGRGTTAPLQRGPMLPESSANSGSRWKLPQSVRPAKAGQETRYAVSGARVVHIETIQFGDNERFRKLCPAGTVHNIEVAKHHTYTVGSGYVVHNCHHSMAPTYLDVLTSLGIGTPDTVACGFTATLQRTDDDLGKLWDKVVFERSISWAIKNGYLVTPRGLVVVMPELDKLRDVTIRAGDFAPGELDGVMSASVETVADAVEHHASDRRLIVFVPGVDSCLELANALSARGIAAAPVTGATPRDERERIYSAYRDGRLQALITVQVLTEGADFPMCDCVVIARPTRSQTLYVQMIGRAIRQYDGKHDALVLDLAGTTLDKKLKTLSSLGLGNDAPVRRVAVDSDEDPGQDEPPAPVDRVERIGAVQVMPVDLLGSSTATWLKTKLGVPFLDIGGGSLVAIFQMNEDSYQAAAFTNRGRLLEQSTPANSLNDALELGESLAGKYGAIPDNGAAWRRKGPPSAAQISMATSLGIDDAENKTRARLSDDISTALASKIIDRLFR